MFVGPSKSNQSQALGRLILPHLSMPMRGLKCKVGYHRVFNLVRDDPHIAVRRLDPAWFGQRDDFDTLLYHSAEGGFCRKLGRPPRTEALERFHGDWK